MSEVFPQSEPVTSWHRFELPAQAFIGPVEDELDNFYRTPFPNGLSSLIISFANVEFTEIATLAHLIVLTFTRARDKKQTKFELPRLDSRYRSDILMFLHTWRFFEVLSEICEKQIEQLLVKPDALQTSISVFLKPKNNQGTLRRYPAEEVYVSLSRDYFEKYYKDDEGMKALNDMKFFPFFSRPFYKKDEKKATLRNSRVDWDRDSIIVSVLQRVLNSKREAANLQPIFIQNRLADDIIKEGITNAIHHSGSNVLVLGSYLKTEIRRDTESQEPEPHHFTIVLWDNGLSIVASLRRGLERDKEACFESDPGMNIGFLCNFSTDESTTNQKVGDNHLIFSDEFPDSGAPDWSLLLASFFPGVTSKPTQEGREHLEEEEENALPLFPDRYGMGLPILVDSVVNFFGGSVSIRISNYFLTIKPIKPRELKLIYSETKGSRFIQQLSEHYKDEEIEVATLKTTNTIYRVKIQKRTACSDFCGNMLTLRIPLK